MESKSQKDYYDEIDLREIANTLLKYKWLILSVSLFTAATAWFISTFFVPQQYQSTTTVMIAPLDLDSSLEPDIQVLIGLPKVETLVDMAQADELKGSISRSDFGERDVRMAVQLEEGNRMYFMVTDSDSDRAARLANLWAEEFLEVINTTYSIENTFAQLESQSETLQLSWANAEEALAYSLMVGSSHLLDVRFSQAKQALAQTLYLVDSHDTFSNDIQGFDAQLAEVDKNTHLTLSQKITLLTLHTRAANEIPSINLIPEDYTAGMAQEDLLFLASAVQEKSVEAESWLDELEARIKLYAAELELVVLIRAGQVAQITTHAQAPGELTSSNPLTNTALAGAVGLMFSVFVVFLVEWWRSSAGSDQSSVNSGK